MKREGRPVASRSVVHLARPVIRELEAYRSARSLTVSAGGDSAGSGARPEPSVFLDANESALSDAAVVLDASDERTLARYPDPQPPDLVARVAELYDVESENVVLGRGADEAIDLCLRTFCRPGLDRVLVTPPTYGMYAVSAAIQGAAVQAVPLLNAAANADRSGGLAQSEASSGWELDVASIVSVCEAAEGRMKLVFLCSPNNPTGGVIPPEVLLELCAELDGRALVVVDEAYIEFAPVESLTPQVVDTPNLIVLRTLSKAWGMAGARFGMAFAHAEVAALLHKVRAPYPLALPTIGVVRRALEANGVARMRANVTTTRARRAALVVALSRAEAVCEVYPSEANFLLARVDDAEAFVAKLRGQGIVVRDRSGLEGLENCVRISVGAVEDLRRLTEALGVEAPEWEALERGAPEADAPPELESVR